ncbi:MAG: tetratricopeptide repeat protein [Halopseudomonas sabulinigri]|tara:strand:+ start:937 stop:1566 length:630 start_codon:yes stop_codon:yes gene_type:complete
MPTLIRLLATSLLAVFSLTSQAADIAPLQQRWAEIQYQLPANQKPAAFKALAAEAEQVTQSEPDSAPALIWHGIILSSWAGAEGGLGALGKVKQAKAELEKALAIDPEALNGSAYTSLGALYYQVPGWPIGFGDDDQAEALLKRALELNPDGIDSNFFWADYLLDQKRYAEAKAALLKAQAATPRPDRPLADQGRQAEIRERLTQLKNG